VCVYAVCVCVNSFFIVIFISSEIGRFLCEGLLEVCYSMHHFSTQLQMFLLSTTTPSFIPVTINTQRKSTDQSAHNKNQTLSLKRNEAMTRCCCYCSVLPQSSDVDLSIDGSMCLNGQWVSYLHIPL